MKRRPGAAAALLLALPAYADVGDPQVKSDHPWYPGELSCSTFERLFATQAELYKRVTGREAKTDEDKAIASWFWRNTHYWHCSEGTEDLWGKGFTGGGDMRTREYWTGLFAHGFGLCGTTHSQYTAEMEYLLGHGRGRGVGVEGHNSFEVFLTGGPYGDGKWVLLDHDISTVIFSEDGSALLSIPEIKAKLGTLADPKYKPEKQRGWLVGGLHADDAKGVYSRWDVSEALSGYAGAPPIVRLRRGETLRRWLHPGLEGGKTFVFWGVNYNMGGIPGPARHLTWVNQPEKMYQATQPSPYKEGQARFANAVYTYRPDFANGDYREGVFAESDAHVTFEFTSPYIIGCTPPNAKEWGIYDAGGKNGLVLRGKASCPVSVSVDRGRSWKEAGAFADGLDLTDHVKGRRQYLLRFGVGAKALAGSGLSMTTVCQANSSVVPRLKDGGTKVTFLASERGIVSAGPNLEQARTHVLEGGLPSKALTLEVATPRKEAIVALHAAAHVSSGSPPSPDVQYHIEYSTDAGKSWKPAVKDWTVPRRGSEPPDFWSQSFCYGAADVSEKDVSSVRVRFHNTGGKQVQRAEAHVVYRAGRDATKVTFDWTEDSGPRRESHVFGSGKQEDWNVKTGRNVVTRWVEFEPLPGK
jgi:hypothetical protein